MGIGALADLLGGGGGADPNVVPATQCKVEIDGSELEEEIAALIERVEVTDRLRMPDSCTLIFRDLQHKVLTDAKIEIGGKIKISATAPGGESPEPIFFGEVTSIEAEYDILGMRAVVRSYDLLHRLSAGRKTKVFTNVTLSDVAEEIADAAGLDTDVDSTSGTLDHLIQANVSDLDFLYQLAAKAGFDVGVDEDTLLFKKPGSSSDAPDAGDVETTDPLQLVWSKNLTEFRARMSAVSQVTEVKVRGWDVTAREAVIGQADAETTTAALSMSPAELADAVGGETLVVVDRPVDDQSAADDLAKAIAEQVASAAYEATAVTVGSPKLKAGTAVSIAEVDAALAGKWVITTARHEFGDGPYRTHLEFSGRQDRSLHGLVAGGLSVPTARTSIPGVAIGIVTDNEDPDEMGRVKVQYPWLSDDAESWWARLSTIGAGRRQNGDGHGIVFMPEVGDEVLVVFEHGDIAHPVVIGSMWNGKAKPPEDLTSSVFDDGEVTQAGIISRQGHSLIFYDNKDTSSVTLETADGKHTVDLSQADEAVTITSEGKTMTIETKGDLVIKAGGTIKMEAKGEFEAKSSATMTIKGTKVAIN